MKTYCYHCKKYIPLQDANNHVIVSASTSKNIRFHNECFISLAGTELFNSLKYNDLKHKTKYCVECGSIATGWHGHVDKINAINKITNATEKEKIIAGWCTLHFFTPRNELKKLSAFQYTCNPDCYGDWHVTHGIIQE